MVKKSIVEEEEKLYKLAEKAIKVRVKCKMCADCCKRNPLILTPSEAKRIDLYCLKHYGFRAMNYMERIGKTFYFRVAFPNNQCFFLRGNKCGIYPVRPFYCRTYPVLFVPHVLCSEEYRGLLGAYFRFACGNGAVYTVKKDDWYKITDLRMALLKKIEDGVFEWEE